MSEIVYIHAFPYGEERRLDAYASFPVMPVGAVGLLNGLRAHGLSVLGQNVPVARTIDPSFSLDRWLAETPAPALCLLDLHWYEHAFGVVDAAGRVGRAWPETRVVVGGLTATIFAPELLELCPEVHAVITGDAELPALEVARAAQVGRPLHGLPNVLTRAGAGPRWATPDLDPFDFSDISWLDGDQARVLRRMCWSAPGERPDGQAMWIANGRGCAFECAACGGGHGSHRRISGLRALRRRDPDGVAREAVGLHRAGVDQVALTLDPDMLGANWRGRFFEALRRSGTRPGLYLESFHLPSDDVLDAMVEVADPEASEIALTAISGHEAARRLNGKRYSDAELFDRLDALHQRGLWGSVFFSSNLPGEPDPARPATAAMKAQLRKRFPRLRVLDIPITLDPESPMALEPERFGVVPELCTLADYVERGRVLTREIFAEHCGFRPAPNASGDGAPAPGG